MSKEFPKMLYWQGGRSKGRVVNSPEEEKTLNAEGWFFARPLDEKGEPVWPKERKGDVTLPPEKLEVAVLETQAGQVVTGVVAAAETEAPAGEAETDAGETPDDSEATPANNPAPVEVFVGGEPVTKAKPPTKAETAIKAKAKK
jgi:hypothetical protein